MEPERNVSISCDFVLWNGGGGGGGGGGQITEAKCKHMACLAFDTLCHY